jgi:hypothetical protein
MRPESLRCRLSDASQWFALSAFGFSEAASSSRVSRASLQRAGSSRGLGTTSRRQLERGANTPG